MKSLLMVLTMGAIGVGLVSCSDKTEFNMERDTETMDGNLSSMGTNTSKMHRENRGEVSEFNTWAEERSEEIEERMEVLEKDMEKAGSRAKVKMKAAWNDLKELNEDIEEKISESRSNARPEWREFKSDVDSRLNDLKRESRDFLYSE